MRNYLPKDDREDSDAENQIADPAAPTDDKSFMEQFFKEIESVKQAVTRIQAATQEIKALQDEALVAVGSEEEQQVSHKLANLLTKTNKDAAYGHD